MLKKREASNFTDLNNFHLLEAVSEAQFKMGEKLEGSREHGE